jgi:hypothetical protein
MLTCECDRQAGLELFACTETSDGEEGVAWAELWVDLYSRWTIRAKIVGISPVVDFFGDDILARKLI